MSGIKGGKRSRSNFALPEATIAKLHALQDLHEQRHGFRPSMAEIVRGLIHKAHAERQP